MAFELLKCPGCGAKLPPPAAPNGVLFCTYCGAMAMGSAAAHWPAPPPPAEDRFEPHRARVLIGDTSYVLLGRLGRGDGSDVFLARRDTRLAELVVLKVARALSDADLVQREYEVLTELQGSSAQGAEHFTRLLPQPVEQGSVKDLGGAPRAVAVYRWRSGFQHTFVDVLDAHRGGVDPRAAVWMWKRVLELLEFVHASGYVHGAVLPPHLLVHPRDHGVVLVGWSSAQRASPARPLPATCASAQAFYPEAVWDGGPASPATDLVMSARSMAYVLGGDPATGSVPVHVPPPLADLLRIHCAAEHRQAADRAWLLRERLDAAAREVYGGPKYVPFTLPGWR